MLLHLFYSSATAFFLKKEKIMLIISRFLFTRFLKTYSGITLFPFIILKHAKNEISEYDFNVLLNHEKIHFYQQLETLIVFFYILYLFFYIKNRLKGLKHFAAYQNIPFEKESYEFEKDFSYLKNRKFWAWRRFF